MQGDITCYFCYHEAHECIFALTGEKNEDEDEIIDVTQIQRAPVPIVRLTDINNSR